MPNLSFGDKSYTVNHAVKGPDYIHGYNADGTLLIAFDGVSDFSGFSYKGTYMDPTECATEGCNGTILVGGALKTKDGRKVKAAEVGALPTTGGTMTGMVQFKPENGTGVITTETYRNLPNSNPTASYKTRIVIATAGAAMQFFKGAVGEEPSTEVNRLTLTETDTQLMKPLNIASGGHGGKTAEEALKNLGAMPIFKQSLSNCSENDVLEPGGYVISSSNYATVTDGAPELAKYARWLYVLNFDTAGDRVLQLEGRSTTNTSSPYASDLFYRHIITGTPHPWKRIGDANDLNWIRAIEVSSNEYVSSTIEYLKSFYSTLEARKIYLISRFNGGTITFLIGQRASDQYGVFLEVSYTGGLYMYRLSNGTWSEKCVSS